MLKDYLNSEECMDMVKLGKLVDVVNDKFVAEWIKRGNLTKEESKNIKTAGTLINKVWVSIISRIDNKSLDKLVSKRANTKIQFLDPYQQEKAQMEIKRDMEALAVINKDMLDIIGISMERCCCECTMKGSECEFYKYYQYHGIDEPTGEHFEGKQCRFAYTKKNMPERSDFAGVDREKAIKKINEIKRKGKK